MTTRWYVAQVQPGLASLAERHLRRQAFEPFFPSIEDDWASHPRIVPLFPGYCFIPLDLRTDTWQHVNGTRGVVHMLPVRLEAPLPLPVGFVEDLRGVGSTVSADRVIRRYVPGDVVRVASGPFAGCAGKLVRYRKGALKLLMYLLGRENVIEVPSHQVVPPPIIVRSVGRWVEAAA